MERHIRRFFFLSPRKTVVTTMRTIYNIYMYRSLQFGLTKVDISYTLYTAVSKQRDSVVFVALRTVTIYIGRTN